MNQDGNAQRAEIEVTALLSELWAANANLRAAHASFLRLQTLNHRINYGEIAQALLEIVKSTDEIINTPDFVNGQTIPDKVIEGLIRQKLN